MSLARVPLAAIPCTTTSGQLSHVEAKDSVDTMTAFHNLALRCELEGLMQPVCAAAVSDIVRDDISLKTVQRGVGTQCLIQRMTAWLVDNGRPGQCYTASPASYASFSGS